MFRHLPGWDEEYHENVSEDEPIASSLDQPVRRASVQEIPDHLTDTGNVQQVELCLFASCLYRKMWN
jgi:hypothetical protein